MRTRFYLGLACILCSLLACKSPIYSEEQPFREQSWVYGDSLSFAFEVEDTSQLYDLFLTLKHGQEYRYANVYTALRIDFPSGQSRIDTLSLELADEQGQWLGDCSGQACERRFIFLPKARFEQAGKHRLCFQQLSREERLPELHALALELYTHQNQ